MLEIRAQKNILREKYRAVRDNIDSDTKKLLDKKICERILSTVSFRFCKTVLLYSPIKSEIDITPIALSAFKSGKNLAYPKCNDSDSDMDFHFVSSLTTLESGSYNILEPNENSPIFDTKTVLNKTDALCIIPALIYDADGYRLGYGKGYYDRFLSDFRGIKMGICYSSCIVKHVPRGRFDLKADMIVSDKGVILTSEN